MGFFNRWLKIDKKNMSEKPIIKSREEQYTECIFEWVKTERAGDTCKFKNFLTVENVEYVVFDDDSRIISTLIGDVVLMHSHSSQLVGNVIPEKTDEEIMGYSNIMEKPMNTTIINTTEVQQQNNPVMAILDKSKKKSEKITLTMIVKIPSPELYSVIKENFDDVDNVILDSVLTQLDDKILRDSVRKELQNIYTKKKKINEK